MTETIGGCGRRPAAAATTRSSRSSLPTPLLVVVVVVVVVVLMAAICSSSSSVAPEVAMVHHQTTTSQERAQVRPLQSASLVMVPTTAAAAATALTTNHGEPANNEKPFASMLNSAVINGKVSLPCDISPASADDSVALILWYKDDSLAPIYTVDARKASSLDKARTSIDEAYANRANFNLRSKPAHLQLEPVRQDDEGDYRCRVDFKRGRTVNTIISLRVVLLPDDIRIVTPQRPHAKLEGLIGPFNEGQELTLLCLATGGKPRPQISWRRDFNVIDETYQHVDKEGTSNELKIPALNKNHLLSIFTCQASNNNLTSPLQTSITLDLNLKPQEVSLKQLVQEPLVVGQTATFECLTHGSRPQATIHWLFQGIKHETPMNVDQQQTSSRLTLTLQRSFNQQPLTCVAENPRIPQSSALRQTMKLAVHYPPQLSIKLEPPIGGAGATSAGSAGAAAGPQSSSSNVLDEAATAIITGGAHLQEGNDIYLTCLMDANPRPTKPLLWRFNGRPLQQHSTGGSMVVTNNQSLVLRKVTRHQTGSYTCEASNQHGANTSKPMELVIRHAPVCATDDILIFEASVGQTVNIDCNVLANPPKSVHYSWFSAPGEQNLTSWLQRDAALDEQIDESSSRLRFKIKDANSFGMLKCKAKNEIGLQQRACLFQVVQAPLPTLRHTCSLFNATANNLQVACEPNEHLKSEEFELNDMQQRHHHQQQQDGNRITAGSPLSSGSGGSGLSNWLDLEAIRGQPGSLGSAGALVAGAGGSGTDLSSTPIVEPNLRLVFPPNWILAELYRMGEPNAELVAYVIVGSSYQLAHIKSIVEENRLFAANPKSVYYVIARPTNGAAPNSTRGAATRPTMDLSSSIHRGIAQWLGGQQPSHHGSGGGDGGNLRLTSDPTLQLPGSFAFTVPNLEAQSKYKLLIYGQNLANRTRDWLVVRGETKRDEGFVRGTGGGGGGEPFDSASADSANNEGGGKPAKLATGSLVADQQRGPNGEAPAGGAQAATDGSQNGSASSLQKSIVMRSDSDNEPQSESSSASSSSHTSGAQLERSSSASSIDLLTSAAGGASSRLADRIQQLGLYKDYAISYAKQKPLLAVPMAAATVLVVSLLFVWTGSLLVHLVRGSRPGASGRSDRRRNSSASQADGKHPLALNSNGANGGGGGGGGSGGNGIDSTGNSNGGRGCGGQFGLSSPEASYTSAGSSHQDPNSSSSPTQQHLSTALLLSGHQQQQATKQQQQTGAIYTIDASSAAVLELEGAYNTNNGLPPSAEQLARLYPFMMAAEEQQQQQQHQHAHWLGSLDRRQQQQPIYLTETGQTLQLHTLAHNHHIGSIDRKSGSFMSFKQHQQQQQQQHHQPLLITDLSQLDRSQLFIQHTTTDDDDTSNHTHNNNSSSTMLAELAASNVAGCYNGGSFSSTECSSDQQTAARHQRTVAFDLSNQQPSGASKQYHQLYPIQMSSSSSPVAAHRVIVSPVMTVNDQHQLEGMKQAGQVGAAPAGGALSKGSDSGGSNSGNTADSGHESPATGETNSANSYTNNHHYHRHQQYLHQHHSLQQHHYQYAAAGGQSSFGRPPRSHGGDGRLAAGLRASPSNQDEPTTISACCAVSTNGSGSGGGGGGGNMIMLMELSPGSQESSNTLLQSVDSFAESATSGANGAPPSMLSMSHQKQQPATVAYLNHHGHNNQVLEQSPEPKDSDNWL